MFRYKGTTHEPRTYRHWIAYSDDLVSFGVTLKETDLYIRAAADLKTKARELVARCRDELERYIRRHPLFLTSLQPLPAAEDAPRIVAEMCRAAMTAGVGPMAAVAGAIAESVGGELSALSPEVIVENGGDIYIKCYQTRVIGIYAGRSPLTGRIGLVVRGRDTPLGICTSSGTVGHSLSLGRADAVVALAPSAALADAAATAIGNRVADSRDIPPAIEFARGIPNLRGVLIITGDDMGVGGEVEISRMSLPEQGPS